MDYYEFDFSDEKVVDELYRAINIITELEREKEALEKELKSRIDAWETLTARLS